MPAKQKPGLTQLVGRNVRRLRESAGLTQTDLAREAGIEQGTLSAIETGTRGVSMLMVARLAETLGVKAVVLFREP